MKNLYESINENLTEGKALGRGVKDIPTEEIDKETYKNLFAGDPEYDKDRIYRDSLSQEILSIIDEGKLSWEEVCKACIKSMSDADLNNMLIDNNWDNLFKSNYDKNIEQYKSWEEEE